MACCAFAAFLLTQLLVPFRWIRQHVFGDAPNASVAWTPGATAVIAARPRVRWAPGFALLVLLETALFAGVATAASTAFPAARDSFLGTICSITGQR